jgi:hypothetical protein
VRVSRERIGDHDHFVLELCRITSRRLAADIRHGARNEDGVDSAPRMAVKCLGMTRMLDSTHATTPPVPRTARAIALTVEMSLISDN